MLSCIESYIKYFNGIGWNKNVQLINPYLNYMNYFFFLTKLADVKYIIFRPKQFNVVHYKIGHILIKSNDMILLSVIKTGYFFKDFLIITPSFVSEYL